MKIVNFRHFYKYLPDEGKCFWINNRCSYQYFSPRKTDELEEIDEEEGIAREVELLNAAEQYDNETPSEEETPAEP